MLFYQFNCTLYCVIHIVNDSNEYKPVKSVPRWIGSYALYSVHNAFYFLFLSFSRINGRTNTVFVPIYYGPFAAIPTPIINNQTA